MRWLFFVYIIFIPFALLQAQQSYFSFNAGFTFNGTHIKNNANNLILSVEKKEGYTFATEPSGFGEIVFGKQYGRNTFEVGFGILDTKINTKIGSQARGHGHNYQWMNFPFRYYRSIISKKWIKYQIGIEANLLFRSYTTFERFRTCLVLNEELSGHCTIAEPNNYQLFSLGLGPISRLEVKLFKGIHLNLWFYHIRRFGRGYDYNINVQEVNPNNGDVISDNLGVVNPKLSSTNFGLGLTFYRSKNKLKARKQKKTNRKQQFIWKQSLSF